MIRHIPKNSTFTKGGKMKKISIWLVVVFIALMMVDVCASAKDPTEQLIQVPNEKLTQDPIEQIADISNDVIALERTRDTLDAEQATLNAEKQQLIEMEKTYKEAVRIFNEKARRLDSDISALDAEIAQKISITKEHDSNKPSPYDHAAVDSYNAEANRLNAWRDKLIIKNKDIQRRIDDEKFVANSLENSRKKINEFVINWTAKSKSLNNKWDEFQAKVEKTKNQMLDACDKLIKDPKTKDEALKLGCGNVQFDNANSNLPPLNK